VPTASEDVDGDGDYLDEDTFVCSCCGDRYHNDDYDDDEPSRPCTIGIAMTQFSKTGRGF
jgi:hypothetical protein